MTEKLQNEFERFWPEFLTYHKDPVSRNVHIAATAIAIYLICRFLVELEIISLILAPLVHTGIVFAFHHFARGDKPLQRNSPVLATAGEFRMFFLWCAGRLKQEIEANDSQ